MDSVPIVAITGQVPSAAIGTDAFQEADIRGITMPITKHSFLVTKAHDIAPAMAAAFHIAGTGRPGPVLVDITKDALQARTRFEWPRQPTCPAIARSSSRTPNKSAKRQAHCRVSPSGALRRWRGGQGDRMEGAGRTR